MRQLRENRLIGGKTDSAKAQRKFFPNLACLATAEDEVDPPVKVSTAQFAFKGASLQKQKQTGVAGGPSGKFYVSQPNDCLSLCLLLCFRRMRPTQRNDPGNPFFTNGLGGEGRGKKRRPCRLRSQANAKAIAEKAGVVAVELGGQLDEGGLPGERT